MGRYEKVIHRFLLGMLFSLITWFIIDKLIIEIEFWKYFIIELLIVGILRISTFTNQKLGL
jgi:hypothetical protein